MRKRILQYFIQAVIIAVAIIAVQVLPIAPMVKNVLPKSTYQLVNNVLDSFTIGMQDVAYATTPDYICDGVADDVEVQAAMNALPATGGKLFLFGGNYVFTATVTRAINNITIEGSGYNTYISNDGGTALFSDGAQTGWQFINFRTDTGFLTLTTTALVNKVWNNTSFIDATVGVGTTLPTNPRPGQQFLQSTTGRNVLFMYDGTTWYPHRSYGTMTVYIDSTDGTDDTSHGIGVDANAYKTIAYAISQVPDTIGGNVIININNENYNEPIAWHKRVTLGEQTQYTVTIQGTLTTDASGLTATGGGAGAGAVLPYISDAGLVANDYDNHIIKFTSGANNGLYRLCDNNSATQVNLAGQSLSGAPGAGDTYDVMDWGTTVDYIDFAEGNSVWFLVNDIRCDNYTVQNFGFIVVESTVIASRIYVDNDRTGFVTSTGSYLEMYQCLNVSTGVGWYYSVEACQLSQIAPMVGCILKGNIGNTTGVLSAHSSFVDMSGGNIIQNFNVGVLCQDNAIISNQNLYNPNNHIRQNNIYGVQANRGGEVLGTASNTYALNGTNENATAANYSYID